MAILAAALLVFFVQGVWSFPLETEQESVGGGGVAEVGAGIERIGTGLETQLNHHIGINGGDGFRAGMERGHQIAIGRESGLNLRAGLGGGANLNGGSGIGLGASLGRGSQVGTDIKLGLGGVGINANGQVGGKGEVKTDLDVGASTAGGANIEANLGGLSANGELSESQTGQLSGEGALNGGGLQFNLGTLAPLLNTWLGGAQGNLGMGFNGNADGASLSLAPGVGLNTNYKLGDLTAAGINSAGTMVKLPFDLAEIGLRSLLGLGVGLGTNVNLPSLQGQTSVGIPNVGMNIGVPGVGMNVGVPGVGMNFGLPGVGMNVKVPGVGVNYGLPGVGINVGGSSSGSGLLSGGVKSVLPSLSFSTGSNSAPK